MNLKNKQISEISIGEVVSKLASSPTVIGYTTFLGIELLQGFLGIEDNFITKTVKEAGLGLIGVDYLTDYQLLKPTTKTITNYISFISTNVSFIYHCL